MRSLTVLSIGLLFAGSLASPAQALPASAGSSTSASAHVEVIFLSIDPEKCVFLVRRVGHVSGSLPLVLYRYYTPASSGGANGPVFLTESVDSHVGVARGARAEFKAGAGIWNALLPWDRADAIGRGVAECPAMPEVPELPDIPNIGMQPCDQIEWNDPVGLGGLGPVRDLKRYVRERLPWDLRGCLP